MKLSDKRIVDRIFAYAAKNRWSDKKLAEAIGITPQYLYRIKIGEKGIGKVTLRKIEDALGVTEDDLISEKTTKGDGRMTTEEYEKVLKQKDMLIEQLHDVINVLLGKIPTKKDRGVSA